jgi:hypothetical protein
MVVELDDIIRLLKKENPDKMLLDDIDTFTRGKLAGAIEIILRLESYEPEGDKGNGQ